MLSRDGPPFILAQVLPEEVFRDGKFVGWRLVEAPSEWAAFDVKPGDVVTRVNGHALEKPEDVWGAWTSVMLAPELTIDGERGGQAHQVVVHIDGPTAKELPASMRDDAPPPPPSQPRMKPTIVIDGGDEPLAGDAGR